MTGETLNVTKQDLDQITDLLRMVARPKAAELAKSPWMASCLVSTELDRNPGLLPHEALQGALTKVLERLRAEAPLYAEILELFWEEKKVSSVARAAEYRWGLAESTFYNQYRDARRQFAYLMLQMEANCQKPRTREHIADQRFVATPPSLSNDVFVPDFLSDSVEITLHDGAPPRFVAREHELVTLGHHLEAALVGHGSVVFVVGEAGCGKTTLLREFTRRALDQYPDLVVASGCCNAVDGSGDPYLPFREILELLTGDLEFWRMSGEVSLVQARRLWSILPAAVTALVEYGPDLTDIFVGGMRLKTRALLAASVTDDWITRLDALLAERSNNAVRPLTQIGLFSQYIKLLQSLAQKKPLLLILDDLQWADTGSVNLLFQLGRQLRGHPILVVGTYRPHAVTAGRSGDRHPLESVINEFQRQFGQIPIDLGQAEGKSFVDSYVTAVSSLLDAEFKESLYQITRGHALFTAEIIYGMQERGELIQDKNSQWIKSRSLDWSIMPTRVDAVIGERIGRLPNLLQDILKVASVEGEIFTAEVVGQVQALDRQTLIKQLSAMLDKRYQLVESQGGQRLGQQLLSYYRFRHILFERYVYDHLDDVEKLHLHNAVAHAIEGLFGEQSSQAATALAYHYLRGEALNKALMYLVLAGDMAAAVFAEQLAAEYYTQALDVCRSLGDPALMKAVEIAQKRGLVTLEKDDFELMLTTARRLGDMRLIGMALAHRGAIEFLEHDQDSAERSLTEALSIAGVKYPDVRLFACTVLVSLCLNFNRHAEAKRYAQICDELAPTVEDDTILGWWAIAGMLPPNWEGHFQEALNHINRWQNIPRNNFLLYYNSKWLEAIALGGAGHYENALQLLEDLIEVCHQNLLGDSPSVINTLGWIYGDLQDIPKAIALNSQAIDLCLEEGNPGPEQECNSRLNLGDNLLAIGELEKAEEQFQLVEHIVRNPWPKAEWMLWRYSQHLFHSYGEYWLRRGNLDTAIEYANECIMLAEQSNSRKNIVKGRRLSGEVLILQGRLDEADHELVIALDLSQKVGNPPQMWKTHVALGNLRQTQGRPEEARGAFQEAIRIMDGVANSIERRSLRETFLNSAYVQEIRQMAE